MCFLSAISLVISLISLAYSIVGYNTAMKNNERIKLFSSKYKVIRGSVLQLADNADKLEQMIKENDASIHDIDLQLLEIKNLATRIKRIEGKHAGEDRTV